MGAEPLIRRPQWEKGVVGTAAASGLGRGSGAGGARTGSAIWAIGALPVARSAGRGGGVGFSDVGATGDSVGAAVVSAIAVAGLAGVAATIFAGSSSARCGGSGTAGAAWAVWTLTGWIVTGWIFTGAPEPEGVCGAKAATRPAKALETGFWGGFSLALARAIMMRGSRGALQSRMPSRISSDPVRILYCRVNTPRRCRMAAG